ncbi:MAG: hypothetical protein GY707_08815, partial [Desulfobacteraceae bacterium]|nr:hypothetical protein [Desulfobacteraceae bacterium]
MWDHTNVSGWAVTSNLASVVVSGGGITYNHDKSCSWPMYDRSVNANAWVIHKESDGKWHANTWDFMRKCQLTKDASHVGWVGGRPRAGQTYYFLVSGIARPGYGQTIQARSNIVKLVWGSSAVGTALSPCTSAPSITSFAATPTSVSSGESSKLNWNVTGASSLSLTATSNGSAQTTAIDSSLSSLTTTPDATTVNILKAKNSCGETTSDSVTVTVNKGLPFMDALLLSPGAQITTKDVEPTTITGVYALLLGEVTTPHNN